MRLLIGFGVILALLATTASAADLGGKPGGSMKDPSYNKEAAYNDPPAYGQSFSWTGLYAGGQLGYAFADTDAQSGMLAAFNQTYGYDSDGFVGGYHMGYNWQMQNIVFGIEGDIEYGDITGSGTGSLGSIHTTDIDWMGSLRARIGYAVGRNLFYATGGLSYGDVNISSPTGSYSEEKYGWNIGAGLERAVSNTITARIEYRYSDLGRVEFRDIASNASGESDVTVHAIRAGISYKF